MSPSTQNQHPLPPMGRRSWPIIICILDQTKMTRPRFHVQQTRKVVEHIPCTAADPQKCEIYEPTILYSKTGRKTFCCKGTCRRICSFSLSDINYRPWWQSRWLARSKSGERRKRKRLNVRRQQWWCTMIALYTIKQ